MLYYAVIPSVLIDLIFSSFDNKKKHPLKQLKIAIFWRCSIEVAKENLIYFNRL